MNNLDDQQKQIARESLQHFKNGLDKLRQLATEVGNAAGNDLRTGLEQIESGLQATKRGMATKDFDPTAELRGPYQNTYQVGTNGARVVPQTDPNVFEDENKAKTNGQGNPAEKVNNPHAYANDNNPSTTVEGSAPHGIVNGGTTNAETNKSQMGKNQ